MKSYLKDNPWHLEELGYEKGGVLEPAPPLHPTSLHLLTGRLRNKIVKQDSTGPGPEWPLTGRHSNAPWKGAET